MRYLLVLFSVIVSYNTFGQLDGFEDSYKRQIQLGKIDKNKTEYYDGVSRIFSNYKYGFSYRVPEDWKYDNGQGLVTVFRSYNEELFTTLSVNILESKESKIPSLHYGIESLGEKFFEREFSKKFESLGKTIIDSKISKTYFKGFESIDQYIETREIIEDFKLEMIHLGKMFWRDNIQFTIGINIPKKLYESNFEFFKGLFYEFNLLQHYNTEFKSEKSFYIGEVDIRKINTYDLRSMIDVFLLDCKINGINTSKINQISGVFRNLEYGVLGRSSGLEQKEINIEIDPTLWSKSSLQKKWYLLYHELGHDVLNLKHGEGGKMMFNFSDKEYDWDEFFEDKIYMFNYYIKTIREETN